MLKPFAIDLDDVIGPLSAVLCPALNKLSGISMSVSDWHRYDIYNHYGVGYDKFIECIIRNQLLANMPICPTAVDALKAIRDSGRRVVVMTSRGYHPGAREITHDWLACNGAVIDDLIIVPDGMSKGATARLHYPQGFEVMIDDHATNLDSMVEHEMALSTVLIDRPWNKYREDYLFGENRFENLGAYVSSLDLGRTIKPKRASECQFGQ
jgi:5'(3')-deoxyribonucleotidase